MSYLANIRYEDDPSKLYLHDLFNSVQLKDIVKREDLQGNQILSSNEKYYIANHGIREAVFGGNMCDINLILENIVYMELLRHGYDVTVGRTGDKEI